MCEELVPNPHTCENLVQIITDVKNWYLIVTDVSDKTVKNWNRMQNATDLGCSLSRNAHACFMKFFLVRIFHKVSDIGTKYVTYSHNLYKFSHDVMNWYQFFSVEFTKCEMRFKIACLFRIDSLSNYGKALKTFALIDHILHN